MLKFELDLSILFKFSKFVTDRSTTIILLLFLYLLLAKIIARKL